MTKTKVNANALFQGLKSKPSFNNVITIRPGDAEDKMLREARSEIRKAIRGAFSSFGRQMLDKSLHARLLEGRDPKMQDAARSVQQFDVRFLTQGSHAYLTLIRPAQPDEQEIDLDDGVYVPMPFIGGRPLFSSDGLFAVIERALSPLVKEKGWTFERKDTCVRVCLTGQGAHIDLPLFAVEESAFKDLSNLYEKQLGVSLRKTKGPLNEVFDTGAKNIRLSENQVLLADRKKDWRVSDPKAIHDWFEAQVERYGAVLRRTCRYMKAWRDETWGSCCLPSLALMVACVDALEAMGDRPSESRDDLMILNIAKQLPGKLQAGGIVWRKGETPLDEEWSDDDRTRLVEAANRMFQKIDNALNYTFHSEIVISLLQGIFGDRFPNAPESVDIASASQTAAVLTTDAATVAMPIVGTSVSA